MILKQKTCKNCKGKFTPYRPLSSVCSVECAAGLTKKQRLEKMNREWKAEKKVLKEKLKSHKDYMKDLQTIFNTYIRLRDKDRPCVSCGVLNCEEFHSGHYLPSTYQYLRFNEFNVQKQCSRCNTHLRGNSVAYRIELINRIGLREVEKLEADRHKTEKLSIPELKAKIIHYRMLIKILNER